MPIEHLRQVGPGGAAVGDAHPDVAVRRVAPDAHDETAELLAVAQGDRDVALSLLGRQALAASRQPRGSRASPPLRAITGFTSDEDVIFR